MMDYKHNPKTHPIIIYECINLKTTAGVTLKQDKAFHAYMFSGSPLMPFPITWFGSSAQEAKQKAVSWWEEEVNRMALTNGAMTRLRKAKTSENNAPALKRARPRLQIVEEAPPAPKATRPRLKLEI